MVGKSTTPARVLQNALSGDSAKDMQKILQVVFTLLLDLVVDRQVRILTILKLVRFKLSQQHVPATLKVRLKM